MPLILEKQISATKKLGVWQITEPIDFFESRLELHFDESISNKRKTEQLVSAYLLDHLAGETLHGQLTKTPKGKPYLLKSQTSLSFSHSKQLIACLIDKSGQACGVDIETLRTSIQQVAHKFVRSDDSTPFNGDVLMHQHLIWGSKEVLYKIFAERELDFLCHLNVIFDEKLIGIITKNPHPEYHNIDYQVVENSLLVWNL